MTKEQMKQWWKMRVLKEKMIAKQVRDVGLPAWAGRIVAARLGKL